MPSNHCLVTEEKIKEFFDIKETDNFFDAFAQALKENNINFDSSQLIKIIQRCFNMFIRKNNSWLQKELLKLPLLMNDKQTVTKYMNSFIKSSEKMFINLNQLGWGSPYIYGKILCKHFFIKNGIEIDLFSLVKNLPSKKNMEYTYIGILTTKDDDYALLKEITKDLIIENRIFIINSGQGCFKLCTAKNKVSKSTETYNQKVKPSQETKEKWETKIIKKINTTESTTTTKEENRLLTGSTRRASF